MNEFDWIHTHLKPLATDPEALGLSDDAAFIATANNMVISTDGLVEGVHFLPDTEPQALAHKLLAVNLSDIAAMGATPRYYTISGCLPQAPSDDWARAFCAGLADMHACYSLALLGGDTTTTPGPLSLSVTILGETSTPLRRNAAQAGDDIWISGQLGAAYLGLQMAQGTLPQGDDAWRTAYDTPTPQVELGLALNRASIRCAMDISDGLLADLQHICTASKVSATIHLNSIPVPNIDTPGITPIDLITAGDDYQLLFTAPPEKHGELQQISDTLGVTLTNIGNLTATDNHPTVQLLDADTTPIPLESTGFRHF